MSSLFNSTVVWHSFLWQYEGNWRDGYTFDAGSVTFPFTGGNIKIVGNGNRTNYDVELDGTPQPDALSRPIADGDWPPGYSACGGTDPGQCVVLAEFYELNPTEHHSIRLSPKGEGILDIVSATVSVDTGVKGFTQSPESASISSPRIDWNGPWEDVTREGTPFKLSNTAGESVTLKFRGYSLHIIGSTNFGGSQYQVSLDGDLEQPVKWTYVGTGDDLSVLYQRVGLDQTQEHEVVVTNLQPLNLTIRSFDISVVQELPSSGSSSLEESTRTSSQSSSQLSETSSISKSTSGIIQPSIGPDESTKSLSTGAIVGLVIGSIAGLAILIIAVLFFFFKRRKTELNTHEPVYQHPSQAAPDSYRAPEQMQSYPSSGIQGQGFFPSYLSRGMVAPPSASYAPPGASYAPSSSTAPPVPSLSTPTQYTSSISPTSETSPNLPGPGWVLGPVRSSQSFGGITNPYPAPSAMGSVDEDRIKTDSLLQRLARTGPEHGGGPAPPAYHA